MSAFQVAVCPGQGIVARSGDVALLVMPGGPRHYRSTSELVTLLPLVGGEAAAGNALARRLFGLLGERAPDDVPPFLAVAPVQAGTAVFIHGEASATVESEGASIELSGSSSTPLVDHVLESPFDVLRAGVTSTAPFGNVHLDLREGVVPGGGFVLTRSEPEAAPAPRPIAATAVVRPPEPPEPEKISEEAPEASGPLAAAPAFESVVLGERAVPPAREPLPPAEAPPAAWAPAVRGVLCVRQHFNNPLAAWCNSCGISMLQSTFLLVDGPRPPLGLLVLDDGSTYSLDSDYVVGREPHDDPAVHAGRARALVIEDAERAVSRVHAEIRLEGWDVKIVDRASDNGTFVYPPAAAQWLRLAPETPTDLASGTHVAIGRRTFVFDSHHER